MLNVFSKIRSFLYFLVTGSFTLLLSACYGVPINQPQNPVKKIKVTDANSQPVSNIRAEMTEIMINQGSVSNGVTNIVSSYTDRTVKFTDGAGSVLFSLPLTFGQDWAFYTLALTDIDGTTNGSFTGTNIAVTDTNDQTVILK